VNRSSRFCLSCIVLVEILALFGAVLSKPVLAMGYAMVFLNVVQVGRALSKRSDAGNYLPPTGGVKFLHVP